MSRLSWLRTTSSDVKIIYPTHFLFLKIQTKLSGSAGAPNLETCTFGNSSRLNFQIQFIIFSDEDSSFFCIEVVDFVYIYYTDHHFAIKKRLYSLSILSPPIHCESCMYIPSPSRKTRRWTMDDVSYLRRDYAHDLHHENIFCFAHRDWFRLIVEDWTITVA